MSRTNSRQQKQQASYFEFTVKNCREFPDGGVTFALMAGRFTIYGCRMVEGKNGEFISFPARKGKDGKYYNHAVCVLTPEETAEVINAVYEVLDNA